MSPQLAYYELPGAPVLDELTDVGVPNWSACDALAQIHPQLADILSLDHPG